MTGPRTVFVMWRPWLGPFQIAIASELKRRGAKLHLYTHTPASVAQLSASLPVDLFESTSAFQLLYDTAQREPETLSKEIERARGHEAWLSLPYGHLAIADRHLGRAYAIGGVRFPTSRPSRASRAATLAAFSSQIEFWRAQIEQHGPDLIIDAEKILDTVGTAAGVPIRVLAASRHANLYYWAHDSLLRSPAIHAAHRAIELSGSAAQSAPREIEQAAAVVSYWRTAMETSKLTHFFRQATYQVARRAWYKLRRRDPNNVYDIGSTVAYLWRTRKNTRLMTSSTTTSLAALRGQRFVFFPLATEPEATLQGLSPEYFFQLETIAAIARDLPADVVLAVKEHHPACGARDDSFYEVIRSFKNVVILDLRERGPDVIRQADVTITISGSAGFEAAAMGKPTLVLGRNNIYDFLPHVRIVKDIADMRGALDDALEGRLAGHGARADGHRFLAAMERISFDLEDFDPFTPRSEVSPASIAIAVDSLLASLVTASAPAC